MKARLQGRRGAPVWQPYFELRKLFGKEVVVSHNASWLFRAAPFIVFASAVAAAALVPRAGGRRRPSTRWATCSSLVYLLLLGTFFLALAGLDPGSAFGGMGASREMTVAALAEPTVGSGDLRAGADAGSTNLGEIVAAHADGAGAGAEPGSPARVRRVLHRHAGRDRAAAGRQPGHPPRAHDDPRGDGARVLGPVPGASSGRRR